MMTKYAAPDSTQGEIAEVWRRCGWIVHDLHDAARVFKFTYQGETHAGGLPDLLATLGPCHVWIEVKTPTGRLEPAQVAFGEMAQEGGEWWTVELSADEALFEAQYYRDLALLMMRLLRREQHGG
jgi:hypothetical protein